MWTASIRLSGVTLTWEVKVSRKSLKHLEIGLEGQAPALPDARRHAPGEEFGITPHIGHQGAQLAGAPGQLPAFAMAGHQAESRRFRAAKSLPAWWEERVSGLALTIWKPLA